MKFCEICKNMLYITLKDDDKESLSYYCRNCGYNEDCDTSVCISSSSDVIKGANSYRNVVNNFTKYDPTLPRVNNIPCPNSGCQTNRLEVNERADKEVIYLRYDTKNMKYMYLCCVCDTSWTIDDKQSV
jgi:DNA-directed RNA polymerase subunit M/transcription elongation factor TFIIS